ncbi:MAG TPA: proline/glycine betaine ABC transporter permease, partial [Ensifer sp.]|nr:proline/glycine betaine ABC transporter permease [Ensifer sp.]
MEWLYEFPHMNDDALRALKKAIDEGFRSFTRAYGD